MRSERTVPIIDSTNETFCSLLAAALTDGA